MDTHKLPLRILYTINSSPQYILAKSHTSFPVNCIVSGSSDNAYNNNYTFRGPEDRGLCPCYASVSLKICLDTICRSSPELIQEVSRDYSVYVLDPLESNSAPAPVNISSHALNPNLSSGTQTESPHGVAVGLGLMSWALMADEKEGPQVTGTVVKQGTNQEALEVIFALRETVAMRNSSLSAAYKSWGLLPELPSMQSTAQTPYSSRQNESSRPTLGLQLPSNQDTVSTQSTSSRPEHDQYDRSTSTSAHLQQKLKPVKNQKVDTATLSSEADRLMLADEIYIGPVKKKGRPAKSVGNLESDRTDECKGYVPSLQTSDAGSLPVEKTMTAESPDDPALAIGAVSSQVRPFISESQKSKQKAPRKRSTHPTTPPFVTTPLVRPEPSSSTPATAQGSATLLDILALLSASSSASDPNVQNAALLAALNSIDASADPQNVASRSENSSNPALVNALKDLISAVSKQAPLQTSRHANDSKQSSPRDDDIVLLDKENINPAAFRRRESKAGFEKLSSGDSSPSLRASQALARTTDMTLFSRALGLRSNGGSTPAPSAVNLGAVGSHNKRKRRLSDVMENKNSTKPGKSKDKEGTCNGGRTQLLTRRSSSKRTSDSGFRHYPRLFTCDQSQRRDRTGNSSYYRTGIECWSSPPRTTQQFHEKTGDSVNDENRQLCSLSPTRQVGRTAVSSPVRAPPQPRKRYVVPEWARTGTSTQPRLSEAAQQALKEAEEKRKEQTKRKNSHRAEKEGKRRAILARSTKQIGANCLSSETSKSAPSGSIPRPIAASLAGPVVALESSENLDPSFSHSMKEAEPAGVPKTPPPRGRATPFRTPGSGDGSLFTPDPISQTTDPQNFNESPLAPRTLFSPLASRAKPKERRGDGTGEDDALQQELVNALNDMNRPCELSSPSSEIAQGSTPVPSDAQSPDGFTDNEGGTEVNPLWEGLPPSSPPPPSSPQLTTDAPSEDEDMDDLDLPVATSDAEECYLGSDLSISSAAPYLISCSDGEASGRVDFDNNLGLSFSDVHSVAMGDAVDFDMDLFEQFTNLASQCDMSDRDQSLGVNAGAVISTEDKVVDFDFTEFWETFKPLLPVNVLDGTANQIEGEEFDHAKLAEEVQALLNGCLV